MADDLIETRRLTIGGHGRVQQLVQVLKRARPLLEGIAFSAVQCIAESLHARSVHIRDQADVR